MNTVNETDLRNAAIIVSGWMPEGEMPSASALSKRLSHVYLALHMARENIANLNMIDKRNEAQNDIGA